MSNGKDLRKAQKAIKAGKPVVNPYKQDVLYTNMGQWMYPGQVTKIPSNQITMQGVPYPVQGVDDTGYSQMMYPGMDYTFPGQYVTEYPQMQTAQYGGGYIPVGYYPSYNNSDGSYSNEVSRGMNIDGQEMLLPSFWEGSTHTDDETEARYKKTGEHLGAFKNVADAERAAQLREFMNNQVHPYVKKYGGWLDDYQVGGVRKSIITNDPDDPRLKGYNDSLSAWSVGETMYKDYLKTKRDRADPVNKEAMNSYTSKVSRIKLPFYGTNNYPIESYTEKVTRKPASTMQSIFGDTRPDYFIGKETSAALGKPANTHWEMSNMGYSRFKKPVQPVELKLKPEITTSTKSSSTIKSKPKPKLEVKPKLDTSNWKQSSIDSLNLYNKGNEMVKWAKNNPNFTTIDHNKKDIELNIKYPVSSMALGNINAKNWADINSTKSGNYGVPLYDKPVGVQKKKVEPVKKIVKTETVNLAEPVKTQAVNKPNPIDKDRREVNFGQKYQTFNYPGQHGYSGNDVTSKYFDPTTKNEININKSFNSKGDYSPVYFDGSENVVLEQKKYGGWLDTYQKGGDFSIVNYLNSKNQNSSKKARKILAKNLGIKNYDFTAEKNLELLAKLKQESNKPKVKPAPVTPRVTPYFPEKKQMPSETTQRVNIKNKPNLTKEDYINASKSPVERKNIKQAELLNLINLVIIKKYTRLFLILSTKIGK